MLRLWETLEERAKEWREVGKMWEDCGETALGERMRLWGVLTTPNPICECYKLATSTEKRLRVYI